MGQFVERLLFPDATDQENRLVVPPHRQLTSRQNNNPCSDSVWADSLTRLGQRNWAKSPRMAFYRVGNDWGRWVNCKLVIRHSRQCPWKPMRSECLGKKRFRS